MALTVGELVAYLDIKDNAYNRKLDSAQQRIGKLGQSFSHVGSRMTLGLTLPIVGGMALAVKGASDLEESINKVDVVFGDASDAVLKWSEDSAEAMGQSRQQVLEAAGTFGNLFVSMGMTNEESADMSMSLDELASDLASFNNTSVDDALIALRSGLVGETEPLKRYGINMNEATLKTEALAMGLEWQGETLPPLIKSQAAYSLIMKQSTTAQGDFARTADGLANSTKIATASLKDLAAELGKDLIPMAKDLLGIIKPIIGAFSSMPGPLRKVMLGFAGILAAAGPLLWTTGKLMGAYTGIITHGPKLVSTLGRFAGGFRKAEVASSAFSGSAGTLGGKLRSVVTLIGRTTMAGGRWLLKVPGIIAANVALAASYTAVGVAAAGAGFAIYEAIKAYMSWQDAVDQSNDAARNAMEANEAAFKAGKLTAEQYQSNKAGITESAYSTPWYMRSWLELVPGLADEGLVKASPGGTIVRVAEGGEDEVVMKASRLKGKSGGTTVNVNVRASFIDMPSRAQVSKLTDMISGDLARKVRYANG